MPKMLVPVSCNIDEIVSRPARLKKGYPAAYGDPLPAGTIVQVRQSGYSRPGSAYWLETIHGQYLNSMSRETILRECEFLDERQTRQ